LSWTDESTVLENGTLGERVVERVHSSGARVAFCHKPGYLRTYACFATNFGSVDDRYRIGGGMKSSCRTGSPTFLSTKCSKVFRKMLSRSSAGWGPVQTHLQALTGPPISSLALIDFTNAFATS